MSNDKNRNNIEEEESDRNALLTENAGKPEKKERKKAPVGAEGHRKRMFDDLEKNGAGGISDRHLLEMLLFYSIPRADTRDTAVLLINTFGSLENVFNASYEELLCIEGVGRKSALLIVIVSELFHRFSTMRKIPKKAYRSEGALGQLFVDMLPDDGREHFAILFLDDKCHVIKSEVFDSAVGSMISVGRQRILAIPAWNYAAFIAIAHNHPGGSLNESDRDEEASIIFRQYAGERGIGYKGHFVVADGKFRQI